MRILIGLTIITCAVLQTQYARAKEVSLTVDEARQRVAELKPADELDLTELTSLSPEVAKELVQHDGIILLGGLKQISPESAEWLATHKGYMRLSGLEKPSKHVLGILGMHKGVLHLHLPNLVKPDFFPDTAKYGSVRDGFFLCDLAKASTSILHITGGHRIFPSSSDGGVWGALARKRTGRMVFWEWSNAQVDPRPLPADLMETTAVLEFPDLGRIDAKDAETLVKHNGKELHLGIDTLDAAVAKVLARYPGLLVLPRMTAMTAQSAAELTKSRGRIQLPSLKAVTDETRAILRENPRVEVPALELK